MIYVISQLTLKKLLALAKWLNLSHFIKKRNIYQYKDINKIEKQLNEDFFNICDWFVDNKLNIRCDDDKTKLILFTSKFKRKIIKKINVKYGDKQIMQHSQVKYLRCLFDQTMSGKAMALNVVNKINCKVKFLYC